MDKKPNLVNNNLYYTYDENTEKINLEADIVNMEQEDYDIMYLTAVYNEDGTLEAVRKDEAVVYAKRNECCGGYIAAECPETAKKNSNAIVENAKANGAEMIITACPLCKYNLVKSGADIPVVYFTELLAEALGVKEDTNA